MARRTHLILAACALGLAITGTALGAEQPPEERLAPAVTHTREIARDVELRYRLPGGRRLFVAEVTTTVVVATLEILDTTGLSGRSIPAGNGVYVSLCGRGARRHARSQAAARGRATRSSYAGRPSSSRAARCSRRRSTSWWWCSPRHRPGTCCSSSSAAYSTTTASGMDARTVDRLTRGRLYAPAGIVAFSAAEDSLALTKLPLRR